jgi:hypothetical protein
MMVDLKRGKADKEGEGALVGIPRGNDGATWPFLAVESWRAAAKIDTGPYSAGLFRTPSPIGRPVRASRSNPRETEAVILQLRGKTTYAAAGISEVRS